MKAQRTRSLALEQRREQLKRLRAGETVEIRAYCVEGERNVRVAPLPEASTWDDGIEVLCLYGKGKSRKLRVMTVKTHRGSTRINVFNSYHNGYVPRKYVFGKVEAIGS